MSSKDSQAGVRQKATSRRSLDQPPTKPSGQSKRAKDDLKSLTNRAFSGQAEAAPVPVEAQPTVQKESTPVTPAPQESPTSSQQATPREASRAKKKEKDRELLKKDRWLLRSGHFLTYLGLFLFSVMVLFRPYELVPGLGFLKSTAVYFALATLVIYLPNQLITEGNLTMLSTEVKAVLAMVVIALLSIPIAKDPRLAWEMFNDTFIKAIVIFIVLANVVRTRARLMGMMWLSFAIGVYLSFSALNLYAKGEFSIEDYRVSVDVGGMFGNPNEMSLHFVMMTPIVIALGIATRSLMMRIAYLAMGVLFLAANMVTFSRGGFLGLLAACLVLAWKLGRRHRLNVTIVSLVVSLIAIAAAPGNYGMRMLSIFIPGLDAFGSSDQRQALLERSILVTARNPWGIGIGNFPIVGTHNLQTHNAFTQVSSELGLLGLAAYMVFMISPFRKLGAIERTLFDQEKLNWFYYVSIGLQAGIVGYLVSSFFASVAYNWFIYYLIGYAVAFRRVYSVETGQEEVKPRSLWDWQTAEAR